MSKLLCSVKRIKCFLDILTSFNLIQLELGRVDMRIFFFLSSYFNFFKKFIRIIKLLIFLLLSFYNHIFIIIDFLYEYLFLIMERGEMRFRG